MTSLTLSQSIGCGTQRLAAFVLRWRGRVTVVMLTVLLTRRSKQLRHRSKETINDASYFFTEPYLLKGKNIQTLSALNHKVR